MILFDNNLTLTIKDYITIFVQTLLDNLSLIFFIYFGLIFLFIIGALIVLIRGNKKDISGRHD